MNRYDELTDAQKAHVDAYTNAIASEGQTEITHAVRAWVGDAQEALSDLESLLYSHRIAAFSDAELKNIADAKERNCGTIRHALAMIVDATVRPTL
tara:strand:- start:41 stop:328 length:288 start_codon:yes stop_codon:yes gene_type:complete